MIICRLFHAWSAKFAVAAKMIVMHKACLPAQDDPLHGVQGSAGTFSLQASLPLIKDMKRNFAAWHKPPGWSIVIGCVSLSGEEF